MRTAGGGGLAVLAVAVSLLASCSDDEASSPPDDGFAALADYIPTDRLDDAPVFFETTDGLDDFGIELPPAGGDDYIPRLQDAFYAVGASLQHTGVDCGECADSDDYAATWKEAMGYEPYQAQRAIQVGTTPSLLTIFAGGIDGDSVASAFEGDEAYEQADAGDGFRIDSTCENLEQLCEEPGPRDQIGRGLHLYVEDDLVAISVDRAMIDGVVAVVDGDDEPVPEDSHVRQSLRWADELDLQSGTGAIPATDRFGCNLLGEDETVGGAPATTVLIGARLLPDGEAELVARYGNESADGATENAEQTSEIFDDGEPCSTPEPFDEIYDHPDVEVDGTTVTLTASIDETYETSTGRTVAAAREVVAAVYRLDLPFLPVN
jgi:hypothetical protein